MLIPNFQKIPYFHSVSYCIHTQEKKALDVANEMKLPISIETLVNDHVEGSLLIEIHEHSEGGKCLHIHIAFDRLSNENHAEAKQREFLSVLGEFSGVKVFGYCVCSFAIPDSKIPTTSVICGMKGISTEIDSHKVRLSGAELTFEEDDKYNFFRWQSRDDLTRVTLNEEFRKTFTEKLLVLRVNSVRKGIDNFVFNRK